MPLSTSVDAKDGNDKVSAAIKHHRVIQRKGKTIVAEDFSALEPKSDKPKLPVRTQSALAEKRRQQNVTCMEKAYDLWQAKNKEKWADQTVVDPNLKLKRKSTSYLIDESMFAHNKKKEEEIRSKRLAMGMHSNPMDISTAINLADLSL